MGGPIRILIVDDHALVRKALVYTLQGEPDFEVVGDASDGNEAVQLVQRIQPDIVLMDLRMPGIEGPEATKRISACCRDVQVIGLSMDSADSEEMLRAGAAACVDKGGSLETLVAAIRETAGRADEQEGRAGG